MLENIKVLDERNISFKILDGTLEVYDQNDYLVGERPLPIPVEENMDVDTIYSVAESCGYNIGEMIEGIISEAVMESRTYDIWLTDENMIFYSPSAGQFVAEPYIGLFSVLGTYFSEDHSNELEYEETDSEEEEYTEYEEVDSEEGYDYTEETTETENEELYEEVESHDETPAIEEEDFDNAYSKRFSQHHEEETFEVTEDEEVYYNNEDEVEETEEFVEMEVEAVIDEEETVPTENIAENTRVTQPAPAQMKEHEDKLREWKQSYITILRDNRIVDGVSIKEIRDRVVELIIQHNKSVFEVSEKEVLFELIDSCPVMIDTKTVLQAGFYQAYLLERDDLLG